MNDLKQVWSYGGGTQSCAIAALIIRGDLPKPDLAVIADTGRECGSTWDYLHNVTGPALARIGVVIHRVATQDYGYAKAELFSPGGELLIPAFTDITGGRPSKLTPFCNRWWKLDAMRVYLSKIEGLTRSQYRSWIGYSFDEPRRYFSMMDGEDYKKGLLYFPLVERRVRRHDAIKAVESLGWPTPPRSRCFMCPHQHNDEWMEVKMNRPEEFAEACRIDKEIRETDKHAWLHKSCTPLDSLTFEKRQADLFESDRACDSGNCFV